MQITNGIFERKKGPCAINYNYFKCNNLNIKYLKVISFAIFIIMIKIQKGHMLCETLQYIILSLNRFQQAKV